MTFNFTRGAPAQGPSYASGGQPADPDEIEFISVAPLCNGKPSPYYGAFAQMDQQSLDAIAEAWLEGDGWAEAHGVACDDDMCAQDDAADMRAEIWRNDR